jgi:hypothetical protein
MASQEDGTMSLLAHVPNEKPRFILVSMRLLSLTLSEVAGEVRRALCAAFEFGEKEEESIRVLYKERDLDDHGPAEAFLSALRSGGCPCTVRVLFRLLGGKGGFGALLRKQGKATRKTTNFDAQRDLSGRRLRHSKAVERIKEWMEHQKREEDLVKLITGEGPDLPKAPDPNSTLDPEYVKKLKRAGANKNDLVVAGLQRQVEEDDGANPEGAKRSRLSTDIAAASEATSAGSSGWSSALDALGSPSSPASGDSDDDVAKAKAAGSAGSASSSSGSVLVAAAAVVRPAAAAAVEAAAAAAEEDEEQEEETEDEAATNEKGGDAQQDPEEKEEPVKRSRGCRGAKVINESERLAAGNDGETIMRPEDLAEYANASELANSVDADDLKRSLQHYGMKCGGSPLERAARLFMLKLTPLKDLPKSVLAPKK